MVRQLGIDGVRFSALLDGRMLGYLEVAGDGSRFGRPGRADIGNLWVEEEFRRRGVATSLLAEAAWWLRLAGPTSLVAYLNEESPDSERRFYEAAGFEVLSRVRRDWVRGAVS